jgi:hypothetical protein
LTVWLIFEPTGGATLGVKLAVNVLFPSIVTVAGFTVPDAAPDHPENTYPLDAVAVTVTLSPQSYIEFVLFGLRDTVPPPAEDTFAVSVYDTAFQFAT